MIKLIFSFSIVTIAVLLIFNINEYSQQTPAEIKLAPQRLTNIQTDYPMLSADGTKILYDSNISGGWDTYMMSIDAKDVVKMASHKAIGGGAVWSPDGSKILFSSDRDDPEGDIYVMNSDGTNIKRLTNQPGNDAHANWSPDGRRIIFNSARATPDLKVEWSFQIHEIFSMNADGSDVKQISNLKSVSTYPSYSPDGKKILFRCVTQTPGFRWDLSPAQRNSEVCVMNSDGKNLVNITNNAAYDGWPVWSPDGARILFTSNRVGPANIGQLYLVNPDGSNLKQLTNGPGSFVQASWSPDGKKILAKQHWETEEFSNLVMFDVKDIL